MLNIYMVKKIYIYIYTHPSCFAVHACGTAYFLKAASSNAPSPSMQCAATGNRQCLRRDNSRASIDHPLIPMMYTSTC